MSRQVSTRTEQQLSELLQQMSRADQQIEILRQVMAEQIDFTPERAFARIDRSCRGQITAIDIQDQMHSHGGYITQGEAKALEGLMDRDANGMVSFNELKDFIMPHNSISLYNQVSSRILSRYNLSFEADVTLQKLLKTELDEYHRLNTLKRDLALRQDYNLFDLFNCVDIQGDRAVLRDSLGNFMRRNGYSLTEFDVDAVMWRLDDSKDGRVQQPEFSKHIAGADPQQQTGLGDTLSRSSLKAQASPGPVYASPVRNISTSQSFVDSTPKRRLDYSIDQPQRSITRLSPSNENSLSNGLKRLLDTDMASENLRSQLVLRTDFNLYDAYKIFERTGRSQVDAMDLQKGLERLGVWRSTADIELLIKRYSNGATLMTYSDQCLLMTPKDVYYSERLRERLPSYTNGLYLFDSLTKSYLADTMRSAIDAEVEAESFRQRMARNPSQTNVEAFNSLDWAKIGTANMDDFRRLLRDNGYYTSNQELFKIMERFDKNKDGRISYSEFVEEVTPKSPAKCQ